MKVDRTCIGSSPARPLEWAQGRADAPITLIEYGSLTCNHCARFNDEVKPALKQAFIDTGHVRFIFRPYPTPPESLSVAMHILTICAGPSRYYELVDAFFQRQQNIFQAATTRNGPRDELFRIARDAGGLTTQRSVACLRDQAILDQVRASMDAGNAAGVRATPSLFINGQAFNPPSQQRYDIENITAALNAELARLGPRTSSRPKAARQ
ncbi:MAG: DsbA family protein [Hyphomonadaceae bacterium]|nr:DsbA family protein [Hyphomonadaceae bacterium]